MLAQYIVNGILMGGLYACLAVGFSLIWGVLNIVNMLHGSAVVLGAYFCIFGVQTYGLPLYIVVPIACVSLYAAGYAIQRIVINRVIAQPILISLTLTFGLELIVNTVLLNLVSATPRSLTTNFGVIGGPSSACADAKPIYSAARRLRVRTNHFIVLLPCFERVDIATDAAALF